MLLTKHQNPIITVKGCVCWWSWWRRLLSKFLTKTVSLDIPYDDCLSQNSWREMLLSVLLVKTLFLCVVCVGIPSAGCFSRYFRWKVYLSRCIWWDCFFQYFTWKLLLSEPEGKNNNNKTRFRVIPCHTKWETWFSSHDLQHLVLIMCTCSVQILDLVMGIYCMHLILGSHHGHVEALAVTELSRSKARRPVEA